MNEDFAQGLLGLSERPAFDPHKLIELIFKHQHSKDADGDPSDLLQSFCECCHPDKRHCDPASLIRTGELVENGGFERGLLGWDISGNVQQMDQYDSHLAHQGFKAATLGLMNGNVGDGSISQVVRDICPNVRYQFTFFASPHADNDNAEIQAVLDFLDRQGNVIVNRGLYITVQRNALAEDKVWIAYINNIVAPEEAHSARITIAATDPNWNFDEHVHIDDVSLVAL